MEDQGAGSRRSRRCRARTKEHARLRRRGSQADDGDTAGGTIHAARPNPAPKRRLRRQRRHRTRSDIETVDATLMEGCRKTPSRQRSEKPRRAEESICCNSAFEHALLTQAYACAAIGTSALSTANTKASKIQWHA